MTAGLALLVDLDGTLVDTGAANHRAYAAALAEAGVEVGRAEFDAAALGRSWRQFLPELLARHGSGADPALVAARKAAVYPGFFDLLAVNTGLVALLQAHRGGPGRGASALVTTASGANAGAIVDHLGLRPLFDLMVTGDQVVRHKPDPEGYHLAARLLGRTPDGCLVIEDSAVGVAAGIAFGAPVLRVAFPVVRADATG